MIYFALTSVLTVAFFTFSGCSNSINSPFSPDSTTGDPGLSSNYGEAGESYGGGYPNDDCDNARDSRIIRTRVGEFLSSADIVLEYNPDDFPPGVEPWIHFGNPHLYRFTILPTGLVKDSHVPVTIDYSTAHLEGVTEERLQLHGAQGGQYEPIPTGLDTNRKRATYDPTDFARNDRARNESV